MLKILFIIVVIAFIANEYWFLNNINKNPDLSTSNIKIEKLAFKKDTNNSKNDIFDTNLWKLTLADQTIGKEIESIETNNTISFINKKNNKQICKGSKCMTIKGFLSTTLVLDDGKETILLKPGETIFNRLLFLHYRDTKLYFEDNQSGKTYELEFFSYKQLQDTNKTKEDTK
jgi:hypothetical protein